MQIHFFEEFPSKTTLDKLKLVTWPCLLFLAAENVEQFEKIVVPKHITKVYWPTLKKKEGYWISAFSEKNGLKKMLSDLEGKNIPIMLDLELPTTQSPLLYLTQFFSARSNRKSISRFIESYKGKVYAAEYFLQRPFMQWLGLHFSTEKLHIIKMYYQSMHHFSDRFLHKHIQYGLEAFGSRFMVALGTIYAGIHGTEPQLGVKELQHDLTLMKKLDVREVVIFRLAGIDKRYVTTLKRYVN